MSLKAPDPATRPVTALAVVVFVALASGPGWASALGSPSVPMAVPVGEWRVAHGPNYQPLWAGDPPVLRGLHGRTLPSGEWIGWAVGYSGAVARYDGGSWKPYYYDGTTLLARSSRPMGAEKVFFEDVYVIDEDDVWIVGRSDADRFCSECGTILHWNGESLRSLDKSEFGVIGRVSPLNAIDMIQSEDGTWHGWAVGDDAGFDNIKAIIVRFTGGEWDLWTGSNNIAKDLYDVKILSEVEAWAVGEDGSESWYMEEGTSNRGWPRLGHSGVDTLYAVDLADREFGWDGGDGGRMNHYSGSCHDDTLATQCWFDNQARPIRDFGGTSLNVDVYDIDLLTREVGWLVGAPMARNSLVAYLDGRKWQQVDVAGDPGRALYGLLMIDQNRGYAVGDSGVVLEWLGNAPTPAPPLTATATIDPTASITATASGTSQTPGTVETPGTVGTPSTSEPEITPTSPSDLTPTATVTGTSTAIVTTTTTVTFTLTPTETSTQTASPTDTAPPVTVSPSPAATDTPVRSYRLFVPLTVTTGRPARARRPLESGSSSAGAFSLWSYRGRDLT